MLTSIIFMLIFLLIIAGISVLLFSAVKRRRTAMKKHIEREIENNELLKEIAKKEQD